MLAGRFFFRCWRVRSNNLCPQPCAPCWPAGFFSVLAGACQFGTAWADLRLTHHHQGAFQFSTEHGVGGFTTNSSSSRDPILSAGVVFSQLPPSIPARAPVPAACSKSHTAGPSLGNIPFSRAVRYKQKQTRDTRVFCHSLWRRVPQVATENLIFFNEFVFHRRTCFFFNNCCS